MRFWYALILGVFMAVFCVFANGFFCFLPIIGLISGFILDVRYHPAGKIILWGSAISVGLLIAVFIIMAKTIQC